MLRTKCTSYVPRSPRALESCAARGSRLQIVPGPEHPDFMKLVEVDLQRCIGCQLCARYCPWETIDMWAWEDGVAIAPQKTIRSILYDYDPEQMHESAESRG